jgi:ATP-dependent RNA helicase DOB1
MRKLITLIVSKGLDPCIVFSFSKRECESYSLSLKNCDFNLEDERDSVEKIFKNAMETLSEEDQQLPQITMMLPLLKRGIGIHHGGLLPIVKEVIELLFQEGLLKVLFTTETFSMGINMPAKTVVFTSIEKFDGDEYRWVSGGEYIQMSGRAGRRGLDDRGIAILMANKKLEPDVAKSILKGQSDALYSSFHLGYNMLLNMMRIEDIRPEDIIMQSFHQFQNERVLPEIKDKLSERLTEFADLKIPNEQLLRRKKKLQRQREKIDNEIRKIAAQPENIVPFFQPGRLIRV